MVAEKVRGKSKLLFLLVVILIVCSSSVWSKEPCGINEDTPCAYDPEGGTTPGVITSVAGKTNEVAITLDACGSESSSSASHGYDADLINYLIQNNIPATLFLNVRWIKNNHETAKQLAVNPLFEIQNHGYYHKPCTLSDAAVYGLAATANEQEMIVEIKAASDEIYNLLGVRTKYYRPGTGMADPKCVELAESNGHKVVDWSLNGDGGSKRPAAEIKERWLKAQGGDVIISHMNHPVRFVAEGVMAAIPGLQQKGVKFVKLSELITGSAAAQTVTTTSANLNEFTTMIILGRHIRSEMENRVRGGYELIQQGKFGKLILTGGCVATQYDATCQTCDGGCTEAGEMKEFLKTLDPSIESKITIIEEGESGTTAANLKKSKVLLQPGEKVLVVSDHKHVRPVAYCLRYSDGFDAYYYYVGQSSQPEVSPYPLPTNLDHTSIAKNCKVNYPPSGTPYGQQYPPPQQSSTQQQSNQQFTTNRVSKNLPKQQEEIDQAWLKISSLVGSEGVGEVWHSLGNDVWGWQKFDDVYYTLQQVPVTSSLGGITSGYSSSSQVSAPSPGGDSYNALIEEAGAKFGISPAFIKAIMKAESGFKTGSISSGNYVGLMQVRAGSDDNPYIKVQCNQKPASTGRKLCDISQPKVKHLYPVCTVAGNNCQEDDRFDPEKNIPFGTEHIISKINSLGFNKNSLNECQMKAVIAAYNIGQGIVNPALKNVGCNNWVDVWNDINSNTKIYPDGTCDIYTYTSKSYPHGGKPDCRHKLDNLKNTKSYLSKIYSAYNSYNTYGLGSGGTSAKVSGSSSLPNLPVQNVAGNIKVMTFNIHCGKEGIANVVQLVNQYSPDIIGLQEVGVNYCSSGDNFAKLKQELGMQGYFSAAINKPGKQFGNAILSKTSLTGTGMGSYSKQYGVSEIRNYQKVKTMVDGKEITIFNTHLTHRKENEMAVNKAQIQELATVASQEMGNVIVMGDFNNINAASYFSKFNPDGMTGKTHIVDGGKIDFVFFSSGLSKVSALKITNPVASDHYPIIVGLN
jgi:endonuclease/exonuclease/phosphatase family metal-dependent hydrolase/peptidoglycan/xylan/chitin deacetylase (PgdA/CDA1 family)